MTQLAMRLPGYLHRARSDSLVRNSLYLMASTIVTSGLGYLFWAFAAHIFNREEVGTGSAVISLCSTTALLTYLGSSALLIERLPAVEQSSQWTAKLLRVCLVTAAVTAVVTTIAIPILLASAHYHLFFRGVVPVVISIAGAAAWTLINLLGAAFIAARRAGRLLSIQSVVSVAKILFLVPLAAAGTGALGLVGAWTASSVLGVVAGAVWLVPRMGLGHRPGFRPRRRTMNTADYRPRQYRHPQHRRASAPPTGRSVRSWLGQHLTSAGGILVPLVLPLLVVARLGVTQNAYFYITEMMGAAFFMISPSVAQAVFAEGVRTRSALPGVVAKALRVIAMLLVPAMAVMIAGGKLILGLFGASYASVGYHLLILLALSAVPDAVSNVAVVVCRVTDRLGYSTALNLSILVMTLSGSWFLMPRMGITGVGVAWLVAQTVGAIASLPAYAHVKDPVGMAAATPDQVLPLPGGLPSHPGVALLIDIARQQSLDSLSGP